MRHQLPSGGISVIIPALNETGALAGTFAPLGAFDDITVVDSGSSDGTVAVAARLGARVVTAPRGRSRQMNCGAEAARGEILLFIHADTRLPEGARGMIEAAMGEGGAVWGRFDVRIEGRSRLLPVVAAMMNLRSRISGIATGDQAIFVSRRAFEEVGGYEDIPIMEDIALTAALRRLGRPACLTPPAITSGRRWDENGAARTIATMWIMRLGYWAGISPDRLAWLYGALKRG